MPLDENFEQFAGPLGHLIIEFNYLEVDIGRLIARLLRQDDVVAAVFASQFSFSQKLSLAKTLAEFKVQDSSRLERINALLSELKSLNAERNNHVHAEYLPFLDADDKLLDVLKRRIRDTAKTMATDDTGKIDALFQPVNGSALTVLAERANELSLRTRVLAEEIYDNHPEAF